MGRLGQKVGKYEPGRRKPLLDPEVTALIESTSEAQGIKRRPMADAEVLDRLILPMINEGAKLIEEGIATRPSDIDVVWQKGFGWPSWKGGPMYYADQLGLAALQSKTRRIGALSRRAIQARQDAWRAGEEQTSLCRSTES